MKFWSDSFRGRLRRRPGRRGCGFAAFGGPAVGARRRVEDDDVADRGIGEVVEEAVDEDPLADVQGRLHRFGGDLVRLDQPGLDGQRQPQRQRDDDDELDQPAAWLSASGSASFSRVLAGVVGPRPASRRLRSAPWRCPRSPLPRLAPRRSCSSAASGSSACGCSSATSASASAAGLLSRLLGLRSAASAASSGVSWPSPSARRRGLPRRPPRPGSRPRRRRPAARRPPSGTGAEISSSSMPQRRSATRAALPIATAQVVELGPAHVAAGRDLEFLDLRRVQRETSARRRRRRTACGR